MDVNSVRKSPAGLATNRLGTNAHFSINASPPLCSTKKNRMFTASSTYVTIGTVLTPLSSSPIGSISLVSFAQPERTYVSLSLCAKFTYKWAIFSIPTENFPGHAHELRTSEILHLSH